MYWLDHKGWDLWHLSVFKARALFIHFHLIKDTNANFMSSNVSNKITTVAKQQHNNHNFECLYLIFANHRTCVVL